MDILIPLEGTSISGLQAKELMGLTVYSINELSDSDSASFNKFYEELYARAWRALQVDAQKILSGFYKLPEGEIVNGKFNINAKVTTLETSEYIPETLSPLDGGNMVAWLYLKNSLSLYSEMYINWLEVYLIGSATLTAGSAVVEIYDMNFASQSSKLFSKTFSSLTIPPGVPYRFQLGFKTFSTTDYIGIKITITPPSASYKLASTKQAIWPNGNMVDDDLSCQCNIGSSPYWVQATQGTPSGINASVSIKCSLDRFIDLNFPLFALPLYYSIGREFMKDRIASDRVNEYTVITTERAEQLIEQYQKDYVNAVSNIRGINSIDEDGVCFSCNRPVYSTNLIP